MSSANIFTHDPFTLAAEISVFIGKKLSFFLLRGVVAGRGALRQVAKSPLSDGFASDSRSHRTHLLASSASSGKRVTPESTRCRQREQDA